MRYKSKDERRLFKYDDRQELLNIHKFLGNGCGSFVLGKNVVFAGYTIEKCEGPDILQMDIRVSLGFSKYLAYSFHGKALNALRFNIRVILDPVDRKISDIGVGFTGVYDEESICVDGDIDGVLAVALDNWRREGGGKRVALFFDSIRDTCNLLKQQLNHPFPKKPGIPKRSISLEEAIETIIEDIAICVNTSLDDGMKYWAAELVKSTITPPGEKEKFKSSHAMPLTFDLFADPFNPFKIHVGSEGESFEEDPSMLTTKSALTYLKGL